MANQWEILYQHGRSAKRASVVIRPRKAKVTSGWTQKVGFVLLAVALGGIAGPFIPEARLEAFYWSQTATSAIANNKPTAPLPASAPIVFNPLVAPDGSAITPVNTDFAIVIPKIGVNAPVIPSVDPTNPRTYDSALLAGVAHSSISYFPDQDGTVYLFSHSTNYDWFVKELNAVFYLLKELKTGDLVVIEYKGKEYTYKISGTKIVSPKDVSYLVPISGKKSLILETCWPPGTINERLLVFADLMQVK